MCHALTLFWIRHSVERVNLVLGIFAVAASLITTALYVGISNLRRTNGHIRTAPNKAQNQIVEDNEAIEEETPARANFWHRKAQNKRTQRQHRDTRNQGRDLHPQQGPRYERRQDHAQNRITEHPAVAK